MARCSLLLAAVVALIGCSDGTPTSILLQIRAVQGVDPDELRLSVFALSGAAIEQRRVPAEGPAHLPGELVLYPAGPASALRIQVRGLRGGQVVGEGVTKVQVIQDQQVRAEVLLQSGLLPDVDGDGVPDAIDNCLNQPNPSQGPCSGVDGGPPHDGRPDAPLDGPGPTLDGAWLDAPQKQDTKPKLDTKPPPPDLKLPPDTAPPLPCAMAGSYTINPNGGGASNFTTFGAALAKLKACGVKADVTFAVAAGTYKASGFNFEPVPGAASNRRITFAAVAGSSGVNLQGSAGKYIIQIAANTRFVTLDGFNIDGSKAANKITSSYAGPILFHPGGGQQSITLRRIRVHDFGPTAWSTNTYIGGIYMQLSSSPVSKINVDACSFENIEPPSSFHTQGAISLRYGTRDNLHITRTRFINIRKMDAINLRGGTFTNLLIANNFFVMPGGYGAVDLYGGPTLAGSNNLFVFNSMLLTGSASSAYGLEGSGSGALTIYNNAAQGFGSSGSLPVFNSISGVANMQGYNCLYNVTPGYITSLNTVVANPQFKNTAAGDLHLQSSSPCANKGKTGSWVTVDIDGQSRDSTPEIGADEL